jgi:hypothetical protein
MVTGAEPKIPAKKRVTKMLAAFLLTAVPILKRPRTKTAGRMDHLRPYTSLIGAQISGPNENPVTVK